MLCIFIGTIQQVRHLVRGVDEESNKSVIEERVCSQKGDVLKKFFYVIFSVTQSLFHVCLKFRLCLKIWFSTTFDIMRYTEAAIYAKRSSFLSF